MHRGSLRARGSVLAFALILLTFLSLLGLAVMQLAEAANTREHMRYRDAQADWRVRGACNYAAWHLASTDVGSSNEGLPAPNEAFVWGGGSGARLAYPLDGSEAGDASVVEIAVSAPDDSPHYRAVRCETEVLGRTMVVRELLDTRPPHPAGTYAILSDDCVSVTGNVNVRSDPSLWPHVYNSDIHGNGSLVQVWGSAVVEGFATASGDTRVLKDTNVVPAVNPYNIPAHSGHRDPVEVPDIDPNALRARAGLILDPAAIPNPPNNVTQVLNWGGTAENPMVVFIDGDWRPKGSFSIVGNVVVVVNGAFDPVSGNYSLGAAAGSRMSLVANSIDLEGNAHLTGWFYARNAFAVDLKGTAYVTGSIIAKGSVSTGGTLDLNYRPLDPGFLPARSAPIVLSYQTRQGGEIW